jgi:membrane-associated PAP2 superfamily phosphatase
VAAFLFSGWFIAGSRRARRAWLVAGIGAGLTMGVARMATGSHFLSDVLMAMIFVWVVTALCAAALLRPAVSPRSSADYSASNQQNNGGGA